MLDIEKEGRIESLKAAYISDEISKQDLEILLEAAFDNDAPFRADWFMKQRETRRKRYSERDVYIYNDEEYVVEGDLVVRADMEEIDRTIKARDGESVVTADFTEVEDEDKPSDEAKAKQEELRESLGLD